MEDFTHALFVGIPSDAKLGQNALSPKQEATSVLTSHCHVDQKSLSTNSKQHCENSSG